MKDGLAKNIRKILISPDLPSKTDEASRQILDLMVDDKGDDVQKFNNVIQEFVKPEPVWAEIQSKKSFFSKATTFDGGWIIQPLIQEDWTIEIFKSAGFQKLSDALRRLRNGLVHSRESRQAKCILPTSHNIHLLRPWSDVISVIASQIIIYGNL